VLIFVVAYEAETTLLGVLRRLPSLAKWRAEVLVIDDASRDATFERGLEWAREASLPITVLANPRNQGYGGNQKLGYRYAIDQGFDVVALLHGDGQYAPERIADLVLPITQGDVDAVLGSRMLDKGGARRGGMPFYKFVGNRILTGFQNRLLGTNLSEFHSGYRAYRVGALAQVPFEANTDDFHFDTEILIQFLRRGFRLGEVPIPTYYGDEICRVNGMKYAKDVAWATLRSRIQDLSLGYDRRFDVDRANERYTLKLGYPSSHTAALAEVAPGQRVLDIGCGPGAMARQLRDAGCRVVGVDQHPPAEREAFEDFRIWREGQEAFPDVGDEFDCVLLLDIIEHLREPEALLDRLRTLIRGAGRRPKVVVSTGNIAFAPVRLQMLLGNFNYGKRGILDLTHTRLYTFRSLRRLLEQSGYEVERLAGIPAPFPLAIGLNRTSRSLVGLNAFAARWWKGLFAYQIFAVARPLPTARALLDAAVATSVERKRAARGA
jgi:glycosyltransferase involved in cell wall biosynthesis